MRLLRVASAAACATLWVAASCWAAGAGEAGPALDAGVAEQVRSLARSGAAHASAARVEIEVGQLDARLRLAPCQHVQPYLPPNARLWGRTRIGLRCDDGPSHWNVYLPVTVHLYGPALVAAAALPAGAVIGSDDLARAEVDLAEDASAAVADAGLAVGRTLARAINPGQSLRQSHLKARQWFAAGDVVKLVATGEGFSVSGEGLALTAGIEGQAARVRTESGRVLTGMPAGEHRMELSL